VSNWGALSEYAKYQLGGLCRVAKFLFTHKHWITHTINTCCDFSFVFIRRTGKYFLRAGGESWDLLLNTRRFFQENGIARECTFPIISWSKYVDMCGVGETLHCDDPFWWKVTFNPLYTSRYLSNFLSFFSVWFLVSSSCSSFGGEHTGHCSHNILRRLCLNPG
jgi:hypothetical protein